MIVVTSNNQVNTGLIDGEMVQIFTEAFINGSII